MADKNEGGFILLYGWLLESYSQIKHRICEAYALGIVIVTLFSLHSEV